MNEVRISRVLLVLFAVDRLLKILAVEHFFRRRPPPEPAAWPSVTLLQPITRGAGHLPRALRSRFMLDYPGPMEHILICDVADRPSRDAVDRLILDAPDALNSVVVEVAPDAGQIASKVSKLDAGLVHAHGEILVFVDDDVTVPPEALRVLVRHLLQPGVGATFGLARYTTWHDLPSSLMSAFVNANALLSYIPLSYLADPFTITGHCYALSRDTFAAVGGLAGMAGRIDDDHELARRIRAHHLHAVQTPLIYDVDNRLPALRDYAAQMKRWFVIPRETLLPGLSRWERTASAVGSIGTFVPALQALVALASGTRPATRALGRCLALFCAVYAWCDLRHLDRVTPPGRWPLVPLSAVIAPWQIAAALLGSAKVTWRGQRLRIARGGRFQVLS